MHGGISRAGSIDRLIGEMTLAEKLGQLTMTAAGYTVTGPDHRRRFDRCDPGRHHRQSAQSGRRRRTCARCSGWRSRNRGSAFRCSSASTSIHGTAPCSPSRWARRRCSIPNLGAHRARGRQGSRRRRSGHDFRAHARCRARSALGTNRRGPGRGSLARRAHGGGQGARLSGRRPRRGRLRSRRSPSISAPTARSTAGRDYASVDISERTLREVYLPPFAAAVAAGVAAIMPAFNDLAGIPMTANAALHQGMAARAVSDSTA